MLKYINSYHHYKWFFKGITYNVKVTSVEICAGEIFFSHFGVNIINDAIKIYIERIDFSFFTRDRVILPDNYYYVKIMVIFWCFNGFLIEWEKKILNYWNTMYIFGLEIYFNFFDLIHWKTFIAFNVCFFGLFYISDYILNEYLLLLFFNKIYWITF